MPPHRTVAVAFAVFAIVSIALALPAFRRPATGERFFLADRALGALRLGLTQAASGLSFWILVAVSAAAYAIGLAAIWMAIGILAGAALSSCIIGPRLQALLAKESASSVLVLLGGSDPTAGGRPRSAAAIVVFTALIALSVQFHFAGLMLGRSLGMPLPVAVACVAVFAVLPAFLSGRAGVANAGTLAGVVVLLSAMSLAFVGLPLLGNFSALPDQLAATGPDAMSLVNGREGSTAILLILGSLGLGLGLLGQPHVLDHVAAARGPRSVRWGAAIVLSWYAFVLAGLLLLGWSARVLYESIEAERVLFDVVTRLLPPSLIALPLLAVTAAVSVTAGSQLLSLADSSRLFWRGRGGEQMPLARVRTVIVVATGIAAVAAIYFTLGNPRLFLFAWLVTGVACGPLLLLRLRGTRIQPLVAALALRVGVALTLILFLLRRESAQWLAVWLPFAAACLVALLGRSKREALKP